ncbi:hypothetical protein [Desertivirga brevis]|uniref:hypothetical protein n=1 Tax=Desertivirga brevis TaxID=2810310 RepID=UPI001A967541|nr:hypothetical protein [Pedobacter sp. SYSU D00873]
MKVIKKQSESLYKIVVSHYLFSALCFVMLSLMLFTSVAELSGHYFNPKILAITHMAALGWGTTIVFGASYQLIPVVFEKDLYSYKLPWISFITFIAGLILLVCSFWTFDPGICMQLGSLLLLFSIILFALVVILTARANKKEASIQQEFMVTSTLWLLGTALLGVLLVFNFRFAFLPKDHLHFLKLHAHMGIAGWFLLLIIGVSSKLIPMFLVSRKTNDKLLSWCYYLLNGALILFLVDTYIYGINTKTFLIVLVLVAGILLYLKYVFDCFRSRIKQHIELPITNTIISLGLMVAGVFVLPLIIYYQLKQDPQSVHYTTLYGSLLFMGWISSLILGQAFKTLPFIVWASKYEHLAGKSKTPLPADLYSKPLLQVQTVLFVAFCLAFYLGYSLKLEILMSAGIGCLILTAFVYLVNLLKVLWHKTRVNSVVE